MALVGKGLPVRLLAQYDATRDSVAARAHDFAARGATLLHAGLGDAAGIALPVLDADPAIQPLLMIESFYRLAHALAVARARAPDSPPHLAKVPATACWRPRSALHACCCPWRASTISASCSVARASPRLPRHRPPMPLSPHSAANS